MRIFVILNPVAGRTQPGSVKSILRRYFAADQHELTVYDTTGDDDVAGQVRDAVAFGVDLVIAAGGDGTVSAVADGLVNSEVPLAILPAGTSNVVAQELGIPLNIDRACRMLTEDTSLRSLDAIQYDNHYYIHSIGTGLGAQAMRGTSRANKRRFGPLAYIWSILRLIVGLQPRTFTIIADGKKERYNAADIMLANVATLTKPFRWGPHIEPDDGRIDICIMRAKSLFDIFGVARDIVLPKRSRRQRFILYRQAYEQVSIYSDKPLPVQGDGEVLGETPIEVSVVPGAVKVIVPPQSPG